MALQGSFSAGAPKANRLSKMSSVPTTEDLRYALAESKKHNKPVELPFENNRNLFIIKVLHQGGAAPRWTFQRGDGPTAQVVWTRDSAEVMMIQNKIKTESAYESNQSTSGYQAPYAPESEEPYDDSQEAFSEGYDQGYDQSSEIPAASMGFGNPSAPAAPAGGSIPQKGFAFQSGGTSQTGMTAWSPQQQDPATSQTGLTPWAQPTQQGGSTSQSMPAWNPQQSQSTSQQMQPVQGQIPQRGFDTSQSASGRQVPFQPNSPPPDASSRILMPPKMGDTEQFTTSSGATQPQAPPKSAPAVDPVYQGNDKKGSENKVAFDMSGIFGAKPADQPATTSSVSQNRMPAQAAPVTPLPAPVTFDQNMIANVQAKLVDNRTGLMSFETFLFFLFRDFIRYEKNKSGLSIVVCETMIKQNNQIGNLPAEALGQMGQRIQLACSALDVPAYIHGNNFVILVEGSDQAYLTKFMDTLYKAITAAPLLPELPPNSAVVAIGAATIPWTCDSPGVVVAAAQQAKEMAKGMTPPFLIFP